jgi:hypothetical protein
MPHIVVQSPVWNLLATLACSIVLRIDYQSSPGTHVLPHRVPSLRRDEWPHAIVNLETVWFLSYGSGSYQSLDAPAEFLVV